MIIAIGNINSKKIEFKLKSFSQDYIDQLIELQFSIRYTLNLTGITITDNIYRRYLIYFKSCTFNKIFKKLAHRLDDSDRIHLSKNINDQYLIYIHLSCLNLHFKLDRLKNVFWSEKHNNFKVLDCQKFETFFGLKSIIVLIEDEDYTNKKILNPHGKIELFKNDSKKISIKYDKNRNPNVFFYIIVKIFQNIKFKDSIKFYFI
jgi:hypothetical protein